MKNGPKVKLFLVDDDVLFLKLLEIEFLQHADFSDYGQKEKKETLMKEKEPEKPSK